MTGVIQRAQAAHNVGMLDRLDCESFTPLVHEDLKEALQESADVPALRPRNARNPICA